LYGHKTSFLPEKRDMYTNLHQSKNNRCGKQKHFEELDVLKDRIVVPDHSTLSMVDYNEIFVKIELRAVMKIRLLFMQWF
jgi:hypothetical protein